MLVSNTVFPPNMILVESPYTEQLEVLIVFHEQFKSSLVETTYCILNIGGCDAVYNPLG